LGYRWGSNLGCHFHQDKDRRYQNFDSKAPISRRQKMKRKERKQSQNVNNVECGISEASVPATELTN